MPKAPRPDFKYFSKQDVIKQKKIAEEKRDKLLKEDREKLKKLHWRRCGNCGMEFEEIPFKGAIVHKCFNCGAVMMLDGTLEKLCGEESHIIDQMIDLFKY